MAMRDDGKRRKQERKGGWKGRSGFKRNDEGWAVLLGRQLIRVGGRKGGGVGGGGGMSLNWFLCLAKTIWSERERENLAENHSSGCQLSVIWLESLLTAFSI
jgi:hypothetical protein